MRIFKRIILSLLILTILMVGGIFIFAYYYGDEIKALVVENLNKDLKTEVKVAEVEFSVWESFPLASVVFSDVVIHAVDAKNDTLLSAKKLLVKFSVTDLLRKEYRLQELEISQGKCALLVDNSGRANYIFWNERDPNTESAFKTKLEKFVINDVDFTYADFSKKVEVSFYIEEAQLKGSFYESVFDMEIKSTLQNTNLDIGELNFFDNRTLFIFSEAKVDQKQGELIFTDGNLGVDDMNLTINGNYNFGRTSSSINLTINSSNTELDKAIALLPNAVREKLDRFTINGDAVFNGSISGEITAVSSPSYAFNFAIENGEFKDKNSDLIFGNSFLKGSIENGAENKLETTKLVLNQFETTLKEGKIDGKLSIVNFKNPNYEYYGSVAFGLNDAAALFNWEMLENPSGQIEAKLDVKGKLNEVGKYDLKDWKNSRIKGNLKVDEIGFRYKSRPQVLSGVNGNLEFNNNSIVVNNLTGEIGESSLNLEGKFNNLIGFLLEKKQPLFIDASLRSPKIDLAELLKSNEELVEDSASYELNISPYLTIYLNTEIDSLVFKKFKLSQLKADIIVKNERIDVRTAHFNSQDGTFDGDLFVRQNNNRLLLNCQADLSDVNISSLFHSFNNFGQENLKAENISGVANASVRFNSAWSKKLEIDLKSIEVETDLLIKNGVLQNYKPLQALSKHIDLDELKQVKFKELKNQILIKDKKVIIPRFDVYSSALDFSLAGTHTFNNEIDYHFTLFLSQLLNKKVKKPKNNEFGYVEDDGLGKSKLYLKMTGTVDNPIVSYDSEQLKENVKENFEKEKKSIKSLMNEEFGLFKNDTSLKPSKIERKASPFQVEIDSSYTNQKKGDKKEQTTRPAGENEEKSTKKSKFGKLMDKIASPNEEEYVAPKE